MSNRFGDILLESGLDEAFRALMGVNPEWLAVLIETESRMRHDEDFLRRFEAKAADASPHVQEWFEEQQAAGKLRDDVDGRSSCGSRPPSSTALHCASPAETRSTSRRWCAYWARRSPRRESRRR